MGKVISLRAAATGVRSHSCPGIAPAQLGGVVTAVQGVTMADDTVIGRDNHLAEAHVGGDAGVLKQDAADHLGTRANMAAVADPGRSRDGGARLNAHAGANAASPAHNCSPPLRFMQHIVLKQYKSITGARPSQRLSSNCGHCHDYPA